jgi:hypothetical protein
VSLGEDGEAFAIGEEEVCGQDKTFDGLGFPLRQRGLIAQVGRYFQRCRPRANARC